jgi:hypothetical protein
MPEILSFTAQPRVVRHGEPVTISWRTANAERVLLGEANLGFPHSTLEPVANGHEVPPSGSEQFKPETTTTYALKAVKGGKSASQRVEVTLRETPGGAGTCTISGQVTGRLEQVVDDPNGKLTGSPGRTTLKVTHIGLFEDNPRREVSRSSVVNRRYSFPNVRAGKEYIVAPLGGWDFEPRGGHVACGSPPVTIRIRGILLE